MKAKIDKMHRKASTGYVIIEIKQLVMHKKGMQQTSITILQEYTSLCGEGDPLGIVQ